MKVLCGVKLLHLSYKYNSFIAYNKYNYYASKDNRKGSGTIERKYSSINSTSLTPCIGSAVGSQIEAKNNYEMLVYFTP